VTDTPRGYGEEAVRRLLATDPRVLEPELHVAIVDDAMVIRGVVPTDERRRAIDDVLGEIATDLGGLRIENRTEVASFPPPSSEERIS
jgi:hypothetical protein